MLFQVRLAEGYPIEAIEEEIIKVQQINAKYSGLLEHELGKELSFFQDESKSR